MFLDQGFEAELIEDVFFHRIRTRYLILCIPMDSSSILTNIFLIKKHRDIVNPGGIMLIIIPIFTPYKYFVRRIFPELNKWKEIHASHNPEVTPMKLFNAIAHLPGGELVKALYASEMRIWFSLKERGIIKIYGFVFTILKGLDRVFRKIGIHSHWFSPKFLVLVNKEVDH